MTTPIDDADLGSMIQDAVELAIGQALPSILDAMTDRLTQSGSGSGRARVDPAQIQRAVYDALSAWQRTNPTPSGGSMPDDDQTALVNAVAIAVATNVNEQTGKVRARIRNLESTLNERLNAMQREQPGEGGTDWPSALSEQSRRSHLEQLSRERQERVRTPRLERNAELRGERDTQNYDLAMRSLDIESQRLQAEVQQGTATNETLREILGVLQSGAIVSGGKAMANQVVREKLQDAEVEDVLSGQVRREGGFASSRYNQRETFASMRNRNAPVYQAMSDPEGPQTSPDSLFVPPEEEGPDPRANIREQSYLASRWTNIAGSTAYGVGAYSAELGIPGLPRFAGQEASMIRAAGSIGTGLTMMGMQASIVMPALLGVTAVLGGLSVAAITMYKDTEQAKASANLLGLEISGYVWCVQWSIGYGYEDGRFE